MKKILTSLVFLISLVAFSQEPIIKVDLHDHEANVYKIDSVNAEGILLNRGWKFMLGDNPNWANPNLDNSKWKTTRLDVLVKTNSNSNEIGWYRKKISVDSTLINQPLILKILIAGAAEIYLNGQKIQEIGTVSTNPDQAKFKYFKIGLPYNLLFSKKGEQTLAIRFLFPPNSIIAQSFNTYPMNIELKKLEGYMDEIIHTKLIEQLSSGISVGIFIMMAFIHFLFFSLFRSQRYNIFFSISMLMFGIVAYVRYFSTIYDSVELYYITRFIAEVLYQWAHIVLLIAVYQYLQQPRGFLFWAVTIIFFLSRGFVFLNFVNGGQILVFQYTLLFINYIFLIRQALKDKKHNGKALATAVIIFLGISLVLLIFMGFYFKVNSVRALSVASIWILFFTTLFSSGPQFAVSGAISFSLAKEFVKTNFSLQQKMVEVEKLSTENQQILTSQNELLEKQVNERTEALNHSLEELKTTQSQLIQKEKLASLGELTAGIAHEIQNPLNFVMNFSELSTELLEEMNEEIDKGNVGEVKDISGDLKQNLEKINHHGKRASNIVKGMLEHSRASTGERQSTDINALAEEYLRLSFHGLRASDKSFNSDFKADLDENVPALTIVPQDLGRVLLNLYNNAFYEVNKKAKENIPNYKPMVTVTTKKLDKVVEIRVKDNANGIPNTIRSKIFQPFFTTKPTGEGTGLGLSLSYDIITKGHGGTMEVESIEQEGTTFVVKLPIS